MQVTGTLDKIMGSRDWALIFGADGRIKGIFIPDGYQEEDVPNEMLVMLEAAGIDMFDDGDTLH
jgi:hypothetical protein|tara:strand:- start:135 stop:326 length:192 start_codon:yes stop_codon:yes gene_type:complete